MQKEYLTEICEDGRALKLISPVYAGRCGILTAVLQYVYQAIALGGKGSVQEGRELEVLAGEKLRDFELLGTLITELGASPVLSAMPPYPVSYHSAACVDYSKTLSAMLAADIRLEKRIIERLDEIHAGLDNERAAEVILRLKESAQNNLTRLQSMLEKA